MEDPTYRLYALLRTDLGMTPGKSIAQAGHAFLEAYRAALRQDPKREELYHSDGLGTKVCLAVPSLDKLMKVYDQALAAGIPAALITDSGHMSFHGGRPIVTALGLGPMLRHESKPLTRHFKLLP